MMTSFPIEFNFSEKTNLAVFVILITTISFIVYWFAAKSSRIHAAFYSRFSFDDASRKHIFFTKYLGFFVLGIIPLILVMVLFDVSCSDIGLTFRKETFLYSLFWTLALSVIVIPMAYFSAKKPSNLLNYPQIRAKEWTRKTFYINLLGWAIYLFGYELLFRGLLLFLIIDAVGVPVAIAINIMMYSISHVPKGLAETIGAIPLSIVLCLLTLKSGTIWIAFFVHIALSFTNSLTALKYHPEINYIHWKK